VLHKKDHKMLYSMSAVKLIKLPHDVGDNGNLVVMEGAAHVPFNIARVFVVRASSGAIRGHHAHKACTQFLTCQYGKVEVQCDDGHEVAVFTLDHPNFGLLIPSGIWAQQTYLVENSVLTVLCDRPYEKNDYIRDYSDYQAYIENNSKR